MKKLCLAVVLVLLLAACAGPTPTAPPPLAAQPYDGQYIEALADEQEAYPPEEGYEQEAYPPEEEYEQEEYPQADAGMPDEAQTPPDGGAVGTASIIFVEAETSVTDEDALVPYLEEWGRLPLIPSHQAHGIAVDRVGGGAVRQIELGIWDNHSVWKYFIEFGGANFRVYVCDQTGEVVRFVQHGQVAPGTDPAYYTTIHALPPQNPPLPVITESVAIEIAIAHAGSGSLVGREGFLGFEDERQVWFIWVERGEERIQATVDADTGEVTRVRHW